MKALRTLPVRQTFPMHPGALGRPILWMRKQAKREEAQCSEASELHRGDLLSVTPKPLLGPRYPCLLLSRVLHLQRWHSVLYPSGSPTPLLEIPAPNFFLGGVDAERPRQRFRVLSHGAWGKPFSTHTPPWAAQGTGSLGQAAPAKSQNNEVQAAKLKSGAKNAWNVRPRHRPH